MRSSPFIFRALLFALVFGIFLADPAAGLAQGKMEAYINAIAAKLDPRAAAAVGRIEGAPRRLLALRGYLRSGRVLGSNWSLGAGEISAYKQSAEYRTALAEVEKVRAKFEEQNPGYTIHVNTEVRTLDAQIASWNQNASVGQAAEALFAAAQDELSNPVYQEQPQAAGLTRFQNFLRGRALAVTPTLATPGLSQHGQLRAFDFQIKKGAQIVAGTDSSTVKTIWDAQGWTQKLKTAVTAASRKLSGPLTSPREPWHYTYIP
jgi:hypothetical protein